MNMLLGAAALLAAAQADAAAVPEVSAYARMPSFQGVQLSPSGARYSALYRGKLDPEYVFVVFEGGGSDFTPIYSVRQTEEMRFRFPRWKRDDLMVMGVRFNANRYGTDTVETRLLSLDLNKGELIPLFKAGRRRATGSTIAASAEIPVQIQDNIISMLPDNPERILVQYWDKGRVGVFEVQVDHTRNHTTRLRGMDKINWWETDERGVLRGGYGMDGQGNTRLVFFDEEGKTIDRSERLGDGMPVFRLLGFPNAPGKAFVASNHETETDALYVYDIESDSFDERIFTHPSSDVYDVYQQRGTGAALGAIFAEDDTQIRWFGDNLSRDILNAMEKAFPGKSVALVNLNEAQDHAVLFVDGPADPGRYFIFDIGEMAVTALPPQYPELEGAQMGALISTRYTARDGLDIPAFVTLPPGLDSLSAARDLPFVIMPHGGPNARNFADFDWRAQFLASRGYGVLQMNFRGSSGYGEAFERAGDRQWGQAMQDDVTDGAAWLVAEGIADENRLAIMGGSYGGYAALMGAVKTPDLFSCAIAYNAVTDLPALIRTENDYIGGKQRTRHIGRLWGDRGMLKDNSPALQADQIKAPVLLIHGEDDRVVDVEQGRRMRRALERQSVDHRYVELPKGSHHLDVGNNRLTFLEEVEAFLSPCLAPRP